MLTQVLVKLGLAIFAALPVERIVAAILTRWIQKLNSAKVDAAADIARKAAKTSEHLAELSALIADILRNKAIDADKVGLLRDTVLRIQMELLEMWGRGESAKTTQAQLYSLGVDAPYAEPLLATDSRSGGARVGLLCAVSAVAMSVLCAGCLTRTRCQTFTMRDCQVTINEAPGTEPALPRSIQIGVQDQMVEGGTDSIASGNRTDPALTIPMGDTALAAIGQFLAGLFTSKAAATAPAAPTNAAPVCTDCGPTP
jgi:hypothetical protein